MVLNKIFRQQEVGSEFCKLRNTCNAQFYNTDNQAFDGSDEETPIGRPPSTETATPHAVEAETELPVRIGRNK